MRETLDYIGSLFASGLVMSMLIGFNGTVSETAATQMLNTIVQENTTNVTEILEFDLRKAGYRVTSGSRIAVADSNRIAFRGDVDDNGTIDSVAYYIGTSQAPATANTHARVLYRRVNGGTPISFNAGVTRFALSYANASGAATTAPADVRTVKVAMQFESTLARDAQFAAACWERTVAPKNLR